MYKLRYKYKQSCRHAMVEGINMISVYGLPIIYQKFGERKTTGLVFMIYQLFTLLKILFDMYLFVLVGGWGAWCCLYPFGYFLNY